MAQLPGAVGAVALRRPVVIPQDLTFTAPRVAHYHARRLMPLLVGAEVDIAADPPTPTHPDRDPQLPSDVEGPEATTNTIPDVAVVALVMQSIRVGVGLVAVVEVEGTDNPMLCHGRKGLVGRR